MAIKAAGDFDGSKFGVATFDKSAGSGIKVNTSTPAFPLGAQRYVCRCEHDYVWVDHVVREGTQPGELGNHDYAVDHICDG